MRKKASANRPRPDPKQVAAAQRQSMANQNLGLVMRLMASTDSHCFRPFQDLKWLVWPPITNGTYLLVREGKEKRIVGYASWGLLNGETMDRLLAPESSVRPSEWNGGDQPVIVDVCGKVPMDKLVQMLRKEKYPDHDIKARIRRENGRYQILNMADEGVPVQPAKKYKLDSF